ncbi:MAG TPA: DUF615 domain-containing protein [Deltaproteobacteria bacterium]|nr:DUF615 domain-containing protein [Deltaproteobacteria bacterium]
MTHRDNPPPQIDETGESRITPRTSKTQRKKEMIELQKIGERLVSLSEKKLKALSIPEELKDAVRFARTIRSHSARKRQMQHIGVIMRHVDPDPIRRAFQNLDDMLSQDARTFQRIEQLREELLAGNDEDALRILDLFPQAEREEFLRIVARGRNERITGKKPAASRALFRYLRALLESSEKGEHSAHGEEPHSVARDKTTQGGV